MTTTTDERELLDAVAASGELELVDFRRIRADAGPGGITVCYDVTLGDETGGRIERIVYVETTPRGESRPGVLRLRDEEGDERAVWVYPNDPYLPALVDAVVPQHAARLLRDLGLEGVPAAPELHVTAYRPGKRAVVRASWRDTTVYLKVVPPDAAARIARRHADWIASGLPVPRVLGTGARGVIVLEEQHGTPASEVLDRVDPDAFLDALATLRERIAAVPSDAPARASLLSRFAWYHRRVRALAPELAPRLELLRDAAAAALETAAVSRTIHGDLHLGQLFVDPVAPERIVGLIDLDTSGAGDPADDDAALWAHLVASVAFSRARGDTSAAGSADALADAARRRWPEPPGGASRIRAIAATHLLGHALTGTLTPESAVVAALDVVGPLEHEKRLTDAS